MKCIVIRSIVIVIIFVLKYWDVYILDLFYSDVFMILLVRVLNNVYFWGNILSMCVLGVMFYKFFKC